MVPDTIRDLRGQGGGGRGCLSKRMSIITEPFVGPSSDKAAMLSSPVPFLPHYQISARNHAGRHGWNMFEVWFFRHAVLTDGGLGEGGPRKRTRGIPVVGDEAECNLH